MIRRLVTPPDPRHKRHEHRLLVLEIVCYLALAIAIAALVLADMETFR